MPHFFKHLHHPLTGGLGTIAKRTGFSLWCECKRQGYGNQGNHNAFHHFPFRSRSQISNLRKFITTDTKTKLTLAFMLSAQVRRRGETTDGGVTKESSQFRIRGKRVILLFWFSVNDQIPPDAFYL